MKKSTWPVIVAYLKLPMLSVIMHLVFLGICCLGAFIAPPDQRQITPVISLFFFTIIVLGFVEQLLVRLTIMGRCECSWLMPGFRSQHIVAVAILGTATLLVVFSGFWMLGIPAAAGLFAPSFAWACWSSYWRRAALWSLAAVTLVLSPLLFVPHFIHNPLICLFPFLGVFAHLFPFGAQKVDLLVSSGFGAASILSLVHLLLRFGKLNPQSAEYLGWLRSSSRGGVPEDRNQRRGFFSKLGSWFARIGNKNIDRAQGKLGNYNECGIWKRLGFWSITFSGSGNQTPILFITTGTVAVLLATTDRAVANHELAVGVPLFWLFAASLLLGETLRLRFESLLVLPVKKSRLFFELMLLQERNLLILMALLFVLLAARQQLAPSMFFIWFVLVVSLPIAILGPRYVFIPLFFTTANRFCPGLDVLAIQTAVILALGGLGTWAVYRRWLRAEPKIVRSPMNDLMKFHR